MSCKYFFLFIAITILSCSKPKSNLEKAKQSITASLKETMHDWNSYESVKWGSLDSTYSSIGMLPDYNEIGEELIELNKKTKENLDYAEIYANSYYSTSTFIRYMREAKEYNDEAQMLSSKLKNIQDTFQPKFLGYALEHSYRGKNTQGNKIINHNIFYLDTLFKITMTRDNTDKDYDDDKKYPSIKKDNKATL